MNIEELLRYIMEKILISDLNVIKNLSERPFLMPKVLLFRARLGTIGSREIQGKIDTLF